MAFCLFGVFLQGNGDLLIEWLALGEALRDVLRIFWE